VGGKTAKAPLTDGKRIGEVRRKMGKSPIFRSDSPTTETPKADQRLPADRTRGADDRTAKRQDGKKKPPP